jgi:hypothetical protein
MTHVRVSMHALTVSWLPFPLAPAPPPPPTGRAKRRPRLSLFNYEVFSNYRSHPARLFLRAFPNHFHLVHVDWRKYETGQSCDVVRLPSMLERLLLVDTVRLLRLEPLGKQPEFLCIRVCNAG